MNSPNDAAVNAINKSTGPRTPEGKARSSMNAVRHGLRSKKIAALREESYAFEERLHKWMAASDAGDDIEEFLVYRNVALSFELEHVDRARLERCQTLIENADETELLEVSDIGHRLFFNAAAATNLYGNSPSFKIKRPKTSWNSEVVSENAPALLVHRLEGTHSGAVWLLEQFQALRDQLDSPGFWLPHERFKCIRLLGREPVHANDDIRIATVFIAGHALRRTSKNEFKDLLSDMTDTQRVVYSKQVKARFPELFRPRGKSEYKQMLVELVDESLDRLRALVHEHEARAEEQAERTFDRLRADLTPEGTILRTHLIRCTDRLHRGIETIRKYQAKKMERRREKDEASFESQERQRIRSRLGAEGLLAMADRHEARFEQCTEGSDGLDGTPHPTAIVDAPEVHSRNEIREIWTNELGSAASPCFVSNEESAIELTANSDAQSGLDKLVVCLPPEPSHVQAADEDVSAIENSDPMTDIAAGVGIAPASDSTAVSTAGHQAESENGLEAPADGGSLAAVGADVPSQAHEFDGLSANATSPTIDPEAGAAAGDECAQPPPDGGASEMESAAQERCASNGKRGDPPWPSGKTRKSKADGAEGKRDKQKGGKGRGPSIDVRKLKLDQGPRSRARREREKQKKAVQKRAQDLLITGECTSFLEIAERIWKEFPP
jgi:hypothetical protein